MHAQIKATDRIQLGAKGQKLHGEMIVSDIWKLPFVTFIAFAKSRGNKTFIGCGTKGSEARLRGRWELGSI